jgi:hypothetical protein
MRKIYLFLGLLVAFAVSNNASSQVFVDEDFNAGTGLPGGWASTSFFGTTSLTCEGNSFRRNFWSSGQTGLLRSPIQTADGGDVLVEFDYKIINFSSPNAATTGAFGVMSLQYTLDSGTSWVTYSTIEESNHTPSTECVTHSFIIDAADVPAGSEFAWRVSGQWLSGDYYFYVDNVLLLELSDCPFPTQFAVSSIDITEVELSWTELGTATEWNVEYGAPGFTPGTGAELGSVVLTSNPGLVTGLDADTEYEFYIQADCGADQSSWVGPVSATTLPTCPPVINVSLSGLSETSVEFSWTTQGVETEWNYEIGAAGFVPGTGAELFAGNTTDNPTEVTGLTSDTNYDIYVQAVCDPTDQSPWSAPLSIFTGYCTPVYTLTSDYLSKFETTNAVENILYTATSQPSGGYVDLTASHIIEHFVDDSFDFETNFNGGANTIRIWVDWNNDLNFDLSEEVFLGYTTTSAPLNAQFGSIAIPAGTPAGDYRMRIRSRWSTTVPGPCDSQTYGSAIDVTLTVLPAPTCPRPDDLIVSAITSSTAEVSWTAGGLETEWELEYGEAGFVQGSGASLFTTDNPENLTGLFDNTTYDVYVRAVCEPGDSSEWRGPSTFTTLCNVFTAPYTENFDGDEWVSGTGFNNAGAIISDCWDNTPSASPAFFWGTRTGAVGSVTSTGPANDVSGSGNYVFTEASNGTTGAVATFDSPAIDVSSVLDPYFGFSYFMRGTNVDSLSVYISNDFGATWDSLITLYGQAQTASTDPWADTIISLENYENDVVMFRFENVRGSGFNDDVAIDEVFVLPCFGQPGVGGEFDACRLDEFVDLNAVVTISQLGGKWNFPLDQNLIVNDTMLNITLLPAGTYNAYYVADGACQNDSIAATIHVYPPSSAGINGTITVCRNQPINLFEGLSGNVDMGGTWYDPQNNPLPNSQPTASNIPGSFNYDYITSNGVCPADSSFVEVIVDGDCNFLSLGDEQFAELSVYPNPATDVINITNPSNLGGLGVEIMDINGRIVYSNASLLLNTDAATIDISRFERGVYTLRIFNNDGQSTFKVVKH